MERLASEHERSSCRNTTCRVQGRGYNGRAVRESEEVPASVIGRRGEGFFYAQNQDVTARGASP